MGKNNENDIVEDARNDLEAGINTARSVKNLADNIKNLTDKKNDSTADKESDNDNPENDSRAEHQDSKISDHPGNSEQDYGSINPDVSSGQDDSADEISKNDSPEKDSEAAGNAQKQKELTDAGSTTNQAAQKATGEAADGAISAGAEAGAEAAGEMAEAAGEEVAEKAAEAGAEEVAGDAAGAATAGIGKVIAFVLSDMKKAMTDLLDFSESTGGGGLGLGKAIIGLFIIIIFLIALPSTYMSYMSQMHSSGIESARDEQAYDIDTGRTDKVQQGYDSEKGGIFRIIHKLGEKITSLIDALKHLVAGLHFGLFTDGSDEQMLDPYDRSNAFSKGASIMLNVIDDALDKAQKQSWRDTELQIFWNGYDSEATTISYENNLPLYEDVNKAEILAVGSQNSDYSIEGITYEKFSDKFRGATNLRYLYRLKIEPVTCTRYEARDDYGVDVVHTITDPDTGEVLGDDGDETIYWGYVTLRKYYLIDLYHLFDIDPESYHFKFYNDKNMDLLDQHEDLIRRYSDLDRYETDKDLIEYMGPRERTELDGEPERDEMPDDDNFFPGPIFDPDDDTPVNDWKLIVSDDEVILPMYRYINQGDPKWQVYKRGDGSTTVKGASCCDFSYTMVAEYFLREALDIGTVVSKYVKGDQFQPGSFLPDCGLKELYRGAYDMNTIRGYIKAGLPVILHISGKSSYHKSSNGHFLVIMGYNKNGFYVYDPGSRANTFTYEAKNYISYDVLNADALARGYTIRVVMGTARSGMPYTMADDSDTEVFARLLFAEAGGSTDGMYAVGEVVMNRVNNPGYPNTLRQVIYQSGQFEPTWTGKMDAPAPGYVVQIAQEILNGKRYFGDPQILNFRAGKSTDTEKTTFYGAKYVANVGGNAFFRKDG